METVSSKTGLALPLAVVLLAYNVYYVNFDVPQGKRLAR
jgi:hypothetical protein